MGFSYKNDTKKDKYTLKNPSKYIGKVAPIFKSSWEEKVFYALDINPYVIEWGYECLEIYYHHPFYMKWTVYYPDIFCKIKSPDGTVRQLLIEVKPARFCKFPQQPKSPTNPDAKAMNKFRKSMQRYEINKREYSVNIAKWEAAQAWCSKHNVQWRILNESNTQGLF